MHEYYVYDIVEYKQVSLACNLSLMYIFLVLSTTEAATDTSKFKKYTFLFQWYSPWGHTQGKWAGS